MAASVVRPSSSIYSAGAASRLAVLLMVHKMLNMLALRALPVGGIANLGVQNC